MELDLGAGPMNDTPRLLDLPFVFTQTDLLTPQGFSSAARDRDVLGLVEPFLEGLHQTRVFQPLYRVSYDVRRYVRLAARHHDRRWAILRGVQKSPEELRARRAEGRVFDPALSPFVPWARYERQSEDVRFQASDFLYSHYQLTALPLVREIARRLNLARRRGRGRWTVELNPREAADARTFRTAATIASALDARYRPLVTGRARLPSLRDEDFEEYRRWRAEHNPVALLETLRLSADQVRDLAQFLLGWAARIDPFGDWLDVIAAGAPTKWDRLAGDGRISMELRIAAELHLRFYEELVARGLCEPLPETSPTFRGPFDGRVGRRNQQGSLDALLSPFGLSPHPRLVVVVEGETERRLLPRVVPLLGLRLEDEFMRFVNRRGFKRNIDTLIAFVATPRVEAGKHGDYVTLTRPTSRVLVVMDPHERLGTDAGRQREKEKWVDLIHEALSREYAVPVPRSELEHLVEIAVWPGGENFEYAHFTDLDLAKAICRLLGPRVVSVGEMRARVAKHRAEQRDLDSMVPRTGKVHLADVLWPTLRRRVVRAEARGTADRIPIVEVLERASQIVLEFPSGKVALSLRERVVNSRE